MNWLDILLLIVILVSVIHSFGKGLTREVIGLVTTLAAFLLALWLYGTAGSFLIPYVSSRGIANFCGFILVFVGVNLLGAGVAMLVARMLRVVGLSFFDHVFGGLFGVLRGALIGVALVMALMAFPASTGAPRAIVNSKLAPYLVDAAKIGAAMAPRELKDGFARTYSEVREVWQEAWRKGLRDLPGEHKKQNNERQI